ncbi:MAG: SGNH/GDSL hydrolase family protein [Desmonostoc vinosum HA7617-LM4]|jgi:phospholipase/lecithinase/hemolysin|nr:SGNH/GDSL hydrolase family protein [Desmonostoc vinosum HA7617-LM4]
MYIRQAFTQMCRTAFFTSLPLTFVVLTQTAAQAAAVNFSRLFIFGDSLSDTGNSKKITENANSINNAIPIIPPSSFGYFDGRFSNGPIWVDTLANKLGLSLPPISGTTGGTGPTGVNFAVNSATTGDRNTIPFPISTLPGYVGLTQQINQFKTANAVADPNALYVLWAGANDYLGGGVTNPAEPVANLSNAVKTLFDSGARNFLVTNLPPLGETPIAVSRGETVTNGLKLLVDGHNLGLSQSLGQLSKLPGINLKTLDVAKLFNDAVDNPSSFGLTNVESPCLANSILFRFPPSSAPEICSNPDEYLFWDDLHPTSAAHQAIGELAFKTLTSDSQPVPEPSLILAQIATGAFLGVKAVRKWKKKKRLSPPLPCHPV